MHRTTYSYDDDVNDSLGVAYLAPRTLPWQTPASASVTVGPEPTDRSEDIDHYGNSALFFQVTTAHRELVVTGASEVEVVPTAYDLEALTVPWELARPAGRTDLRGAWRAVDLALPSPLVELTPGVSTYAAASLRPGRPLGEAVDDLVHRIFTDFDYDSTATTVTSTIAHVLTKRAGVCQDFAQLAIAGLRANGLAARYVSGYLSTMPPPGQERIVGGDATHAWLVVWVPEEAGGHWLAVDPTNDVRVGDRHVTVAWGRDYGDVPPLKGVIFTDAETSTLSVEVDVEPVG